MTRSMRTHVNLGADGNGKCGEPRRSRSIKILDTNGKVSKRRVLSVTFSPGEFVPRCRLGVARRWAARQGTLPAGLVSLMGRAPTAAFSCWRR